MGFTERKEKERLARKNAIIKSAEKIFFQKGFENSTMDDIAKEAEFTKKTLYSYFKSKEELYYEIMLEGFKILNSLCDKTLKEYSDFGEIEKIKKLGEMFIEFSKVYPGYFKAISDYENKDFDFKQDESNSLVNECNIAGNYSFEILNRCVAEGIKNGEISNKFGIDTICVMLWGCISGIIGILNKKEKYIKAYYNKNGEDLIENGYEMILGAIKG